MIAWEVILTVLMVIGIPFGLGMAVWTDSAGWLLVSLLCIIIFAAG